MPIGRMLNKKISSNEELSKFSIHTLLIFTWIIPHLDVKGRILGDVSYLKATIFPLIDKITKRAIAKALKELHENDLIFLYGRKIKYIQFTGFERNQRINERKEAKSTIPDPDYSGANSIPNSRVDSRPNSGHKLKVKDKVKIKLKVKGESEDQGEPQTSNFQTSNSPNFEKNFPLLTDESDYLPIDFNNENEMRKKVTELLKSFCGIEQPEKATVSSFVNIIKNAKQIPKTTAFHHVFITFKEANLLPDGKRNTAYLYKQARGRVNDKLIVQREINAKELKKQDNQELEKGPLGLVDSPIDDLVNKFAINKQ